MSLRAVHLNLTRNLRMSIRYQGDIDGFVAESRNMAEQGSSSIHTINPVQITLNGDKAFSVSVGSIISRFSKDEIDYDLVSQCRFLSRLERAGDDARRGWKMLSMEVIYVHDAIMPAVPAELREDVYSVIAEGRAPRESYRGLAYVLGEMGYQVKDTLPGTDDQSSVEAVLQRNQSWLYK